MRNYQSRNWGLIIAIDVICDVMISVLLNKKCVFAKTERLGRHF